CMLPYFIFLICSPRHLSIIFPYTTLFRSLNVGGVTADAFGSTLGTLRARPGTDTLFVSLPTREVSGETTLRRAGVKRLDFASGIDRKSTRLNSSHVKISYAVFCLKKKKNN